MVKPQGLPNHDPCTNGQKTVYAPLGSSGLQYDSVEYNHKTIRTFTVGRCIILLRHTKTNAFSRFSLERDRERDLERDRERDLERDRERDRDLIVELIVLRMIRERITSRSHSKQFESKCTCINVHAHVIA